MTAELGRTTSPNGDRQRIDKWLVCARFVKTRGLAVRLVEGKRVRLNGRRIDRAHALVGPGDVLTLPLGRVVRVVRILALAERRGPASEARLLYEEIHEAAP